MDIKWRSRPLAIKVKSPVRPYPDLTKQPSRFSYPAIAMKTITSLLQATACAAVLFVGAQAAPQIGQAAPDFSLADLTGKKISLSDFKGKTVVLEWVNPECPFVQKHYDKSGNLPAIQKEATGDGVIWLSINSAHPGAQGDFDQAKVEAWMKSNNGRTTAYFRDQAGTVGRLYDARTTPHLFIVNAAGVLVYAGGIDDIRSANPADIAKAKNYVQAALADLKAGQPVATPASKPYGCGVHYGK